jgi:DNA-binding NtrC family response regulator
MAFFVLLVEDETTLRKVMKLITAFATVEQAVEALKQGAYQYLCKPFEMEELIHHVLVTGPSGTGKSMAARAIHRLSSRRDAPIVAVNGAGIPESLLESQLFGHEAGSFTGAKQRHNGYFEHAQGGTLVLDEIGNLPLSAQASVLQVIQEHSFLRVGGTKPIEVDFRLICATNQALDAKLETGEFRLDLYYHLNVVEVRIPPLRDRPESIPLLADTFQRRYCAQTGKAIRGFAPDVSSFQDRRCRSRASAGRS